MATATSARRALGVIRLSVGGLNQTGEETQRRKITNRCIADEVELQEEFAIDVDVSASLSPWNRPQLGKWLNERRDQFDVLYVLKIDRIVRSVRDLSNLLEWCEKHNKSLVSVEEGFDLGTSWGRTIAKILAVLAEAELDAIKDRIRNNRNEMRAQGRWPGGLVPFGRVSVPSEEGAGYTLKLCPEYGPWLLKVIAKFHEVRNFAEVARWLNESAVPTTQDIARMRAVKAKGTNTRLSEEKAAPRGALWTATSVQAVLTSRSLIGEYTRKDGSIERDSAGEPILRSMPVMSAEKFQELQTVIQTVKYTKGGRSTSPLLGVLHCTCGKPLYYDKETAKHAARFKCVGNNSKGIKACPGQAYPASQILEEFQLIFTRVLGDLPVMEKRLTTDDSSAVQMAILDAKLDQYMKEFKAGRISAREFTELNSKTALEMETLSQTPAGAPKVEWVSTGQTYGEWYGNTTPGERREKLVTWGIKAVRSAEGMTANVGPEVFMRAAKGEPLIAEKIQHTNYMLWVKA
ncbi:recombinase family protein [Streptomyces sp. NPDC005385]|uniref:recombinase family protein n=1 Tax=Streptomyces sp. NPDC005385 TaxID=3157039 RepID=UPI0033BA17F5